MRGLARATRLDILAHSALSLGLIAFTFLETVQSLRHHPGGDAHGPRLDLRRRRVGAGGEGGALAAAGSVGVR
jgi:hypothetical protein